MERCQQLYSLGQAKCVTIALSLSWRWAERLAGGVLWDVEYANDITKSSAAL